MGGASKTSASLWIVLAFGVQLKIWRVSQHQTQTLHRLNLPFGLCRLCHPQPRFFVMIIRAAASHFHVHDLNDVARAPRTESVHPYQVLLDFKPDRSCIWSTFHAALTLLDADLTLIICFACSWCLRLFCLFFLILKVKMTYLLTCTCKNNIPKYLMHKKHPKRRRFLKEGRLKRLRAQEDKGGSYAIKFNFTAPHVGCS